MTRGVQAHRRARPRAPVQQQLGTPARVEGAPCCAARGARVSPSAAPSPTSRTHRCRPGRRRTSQARESGMPRLGRDRRIERGPLLHGRRSGHAGDSGRHDSRAEEDRTRSRRRATSPSPRPTLRATTAINPGSSEGRSSDSCADSGLSSRGADMPPTERRPAPGHRRMGVVTYLDQAGRGQRP